MIELSQLDARVIGALLEKEITTPDQYPLSIKGLVTACNQKSNREPVMSLEEDQVQNVVDDLKSRGLISEVLFGGRVAKYKHRFCNTEFSQLHLNPTELGVICVMLLRGPQTPGELRSRTNRLCEFNDVSEVEAVLNRLMDREGRAYVAKLPREPGKRESRYMQLFTGDEVPTSSQEEEFSQVAPENKASSDLEARVKSLEAQLLELSEAFNKLQSEWDALNS